MTTHRATVPAELCSGLSLAVQEQAVGSAAEATCWIILEQNGPWGAKAATRSRLDPDLGARLDAAATAVGGRFGLMRNPGAHPDWHHTKRRVLVSGGPVTDPWLVSGVVDAPERLLDLPWEHLSDAEPYRLLAALPELESTSVPVLLVCTNGKRDRCCAVVARPVAEAAHLLHPGRVYETTHLGGHRFATTAVLLPTGHTYAHLSGETAAEVLGAADEGRVPATLADDLHYRGRSGLSRPAQVAEHAVREILDDWSLPGPHVGEVTPVGGDAWRVRVGSVAVLVERWVTDRMRPESCGKPPTPVPAWRFAVERSAATVDGSTPADPRWPVVSPGGPMGLHFAMASLSSLNIDGKP